MCVKGEMRIKCVLSGEVAACHPATHTSFSVHRYMLKGERVMCVFGGSGGPANVRVCLNFLHLPYNFSHITAVS